METPTHSTLPLHRIVQGKNPRNYFDPLEMADLEAGLRAAGRVIQPIFVRPVADDSGQYEIVAGERRWRAAKTIFGDDYAMPVTIDALSDAQAEAFATIENHHRASMSHAEEAQAAKRTLLRCKGDKEEAAATLGWKPELLERRLALLTCTPAVLDALTQRKVQLGHAELLAGIPSDKQDSVLAGVLAHKVPVGVLKEQLGRFARRLADALFDTAQCAACPHNSARQSGLFDETLGEGFCQHPAHYDELTLQTIEAKAQGLREQYPTVRIIKASDAFTPLPVAEDGELGVGKQQYEACKGCASFGCAVSALPGSQGEVTVSLCFDAVCNSQKVAAWRKARRENAGKGETKGGAPKGKTAGKTSPRQTATAGKLPQRVAEYRVAQWRKWAARDLMAQPERNHRVMVALALSGHAGDVRSAEFEQAVKKITRETKGACFRGHLHDADGIGAQHLERLMLAVTASAAFGVGQSELEVLLNYLEVDESRHFKWNAEFLELFTISELDALAGEVGLKSTMGVGFKFAKEKKKAAFIQALLHVSGFPYEGKVPAVMRYPRRPAVPGQTGEDSEASDGSGSEASDESAQETACAA